VAVKTKTFDYRVELDGAGRMTIPGSAAFTPPEGWSADHMLLAALARCSVQSLAHHARRAGHQVVTSAVSAHGTVKKSDEDGRYRFARIDVRVDATLEPNAGDVQELIAKAERDCFIGASLALDPEYEWHVS